MNIENRIDAAEPVFPRLLLILNEGGSKRGFVRVVAGGLDGFALIDLVDPERAGLKRLPVKEANQSAGRDGSELRGRLGYVCELKCSLFA